MDTKKILVTMKLDYDSEHIDIILDAIINTIMGGPTLVSFKENIDYSFTFTS